MRPQTMMIGVLALVLGGGAAAWTRGLVNNRTEAAPVDTVPVVVALVDMPRGGMITPDMIKTRDFPKGVAAAGALMKIEEAIERTVGIPIVKGEPILEAKLSPKGSGRGMAALIPKGMRALTIQTPNIATGVAGFILPGNRVDVLLTITDNGANDDTGGGSTSTLLQRVEILAVDQKTDAPAENKMDANNLRSVTLVVTPDQAKQLELGQNRGTLHLALRNPDDDDKDASRPVTLNGIRFKQGKPWEEKAKGVLEAFGNALAKMPPPPPPPPPAPVVVKEAPKPAPVLVAKPEVRTIRTIRGTQEGATPITYSGTLVRER